MPTARTRRTAARRRPRKRLPAAQRRALTLERVKELFARRGFAGSTSRQLARAAGVNEALLYRMFGTKQGLFAALIEREIAQAGEAIFEREAAARGDDEGVFGTVARELLKRLEADPAFFRLMLYSGLEEHELAEMFYQARVKRLNGFLADYVRRRQREGAFRSELDPELLALTFIGMVVHYALAVQIFGREEFRRPPEQVARSCVGVLLEGVRSRPAGRLSAQQSPGAGARLEDER
ncbi:MAG: hypothetical protein KatS3mg102_0733 [Planctomycetota bacterium]|nr:MAG: hypothetical protein KatS3mg102_0733 [Planctomycetota bacterium]